jgi:predicted ferric reductase
MDKKIKRIIALLIYLLLIFLPLIVYFAFPMPPRREWWRDLSVMMGFVGLSIAGLQFLPTARIPFLSDVFDLDGIYRVHHFLSVLSVLMVFLHPVLLLVNNPYTLLLLNPLTAPWRAQAGMIGLSALILISITSVLRKEIKLDYNAWHSIHDLLTIVIAIFALIHLVKVNYYMAIPAMQVCWVLQAVIWIGITIYVRLLKPLAIKKRPYIVNKLVTELPDTWSLILKPDRHDGMDFQAGQVAWLNINSSPFTLHRNPFSISGSAHQPDELRFSIKNVGDFTKAVGKIKGGETVYVDGPYGSFSTEDPKTKEGLVLLAGGIGAAPVMSILHTLADEKDKRPLIFLYGNYDDKNITFFEEIKKLEKELNLSITHILEVPSKKVKSDVGFITKEILERDLPRNRNHLYYFICGPMPMIEAMESHLRALGIPRGQVTSEKYEMA